MDTERAQPLSRAWSTRRRVIMWLLAGVVLAVAVGGTVAAIALGSGERSASESPAPSADAAGTTAVFLGDSYTKGWGASKQSLRWSTLVAGSAGWIEVNQGQGGTGFVTDAGEGGCGLEYCPPYLERVPKVLAAQPDIVVISGGQNDLTAFDADPDAVHAAITETYQRIREGLPEARIIAVGPSLPQPDDSRIAKIDEWVRAVAKTVDADYVSLIDPTLIDPDMIASDHVHVNDAGHQAIANRVLDTMD
ncbi:SGNH/GDSL hydrolase family protein [Cryobacterium sp. AP23]